MLISRETKTQKRQQDIIQGTTISKETKVQKRQQDKIQGTMDLQNIQKTTLKMAIVSAYLLIIILNINRINSSIKRHGMSE